MSKYKQIITLQRVFFDEVEHEVTVKNIDGKFHVRVFTNGQLNQEAVCESRSDIGYTCRSLLRWEDKCGNFSAFASSARERLNKQK